MTKSEFINALRGCLAGIPEDEINSTVDFYCEMIDERMEEGFSEEDAVLAAGAPEQIAERIRRESGSKPESKPIKKKRRMKPWEIVLLVVGSPLWVSLGAVAIVIILSLYIVVWSLLLVLYSVTVSFGAGVIAGVFSAVMMFAAGTFPVAAVYLGAALLCAGLTVFAAILSGKATKGMWYLTVKPIRALVRAVFGEKDNEEGGDGK